MSATGLNVVHLSFECSRFNRCYGNDAVFFSAYVEREVEVDLHV